ncbi:hypothetical protein [Pseudonocardia sp. ICBG1142]|uniref:hypothetical protein n=1 Tax=Pseudonocardia sp. ICBG1142 TaxID=2846760 RepID=UPI001CF607CC|nr:hypothetical protein [Pseudonocardia sp. ICBG1142]
MNARAATTATPQAKTHARTAARELLRARIQPITALAELATAVNTARTHLDDARQRWRNAQTAYAHAYRAARDAGWSPTELHDIGCGTQPAGTALRTTRPDNDSTTPTPAPPVTTDPEPRPTDTTDTTDNATAGHSAHEAGPR